MKYLIADDDPVSRLALSYKVADFSNATVVQAEDGDAAWQMLEEMDEPVISLLDNRMPGMSGVELLKKMRQSVRYIGWPVLLVTSTADRGLVSEAVQCGVDGFVMKPVGQEAVSRILAVAARFESCIMEPFSETASRLDINLTKYQACIQALVKQLDLLILSLQDVTNDNLQTIRQRADTCRSAATALGSQHLDRIFETLLPKLDAIDTSGTYASFAEAIRLTRNRIGQMIQA